VRHRGRARFVAAPVFAESAAYLLSPRRTPSERVSCARSLPCSLHAVLCSYAAQTTTHQDWERAGAAGSRFARDDKELGPQLGTRLAKQREKVGKVLRREVVCCVDLLEKKCKFGGSKKIVCTCVGFVVFLVGPKIRVVFSVVPFFWGVQDFLLYFGGSKVLLDFWCVTASSLLASVVSLGGIVFVVVAD
jgi:hypothetical protein